MPPLPSNAVSLGAVPLGVVPATGNGRRKSALALVPRGPVEPVLLEFQSPSSALIQRPVPLRSRFVVWVIASLVATTVAAAALVPIDRMVTTNGKIVAMAPNVVVQPLETAIVRSIEVREGQVVKAGEVLARLDPTFANADAGSLETEAASLRAEVERLHAELENHPYVPDGSPASLLQATLLAQRAAERDFKLRDFQEKIEGARSKVAQAKASIESYGQRLEVAQTIEQKRIKLEQLQVGTQLNTLAAIDARVEIQRNLNAARSGMASAQNEQNSLVAERDGYLHQFNAQASQTLSEEERKLATAEENLNKAKLRRSLVELRADRPAIVLTVAPVSVGAVLQSGDQLFTLVPMDSPLEVETLANARDTGFVNPGDRVTIKFDTFPYYTYGVANGVVRTVSPDSFRRPMDDRERVTRPHTEQEAGTLYYRTRITLGEIHLHDLPPGFRLAPGMPVTADIKVGKRTMVQYMMSRAIPAVSEGMHEP